MNEGELPDCLSLLSSLQYLDLYSNQIHGPVPESYKKLQDLRWLLLRSNRTTFWLSYPRICIANDDIHTPPPNRDVWLSDNEILASRNELKLMLPNCRIRLWYLYKCTHSCYNIYYCLSVSFWMNSWDLKITFLFKCFFFFFFKSLC